MRLDGRSAIAIGAFNMAALLLIAVGSVNDRAQAAIPADSLPVSSIAASLERGPVERVISITAEEGSYSVTAIDRTGREVRLSVDPRTARPLS